MGSGQLAVGSGQLAVGSWQLAVGSEYGENIMETQKPAICGLFVLCGEGGIRTLDSPIRTMTV